MMRNGKEEKTFWNLPLREMKKAKVELIRMEYKWRIKDEGNRIAGRLWNTSMEL